MELPVYKMYIDPEDDSLQVDAVAFVKNPAIEKNFMAFSAKTKFSITNEEQRVVSGPLMLANTPIYRNDEGGEYYVVFEPETIKQIVQKFFAQGFQGNVNLAHDPNQQVEDVFMFESWIVDSARGIKPMEGFEDVPDGSWFGSFKVDNDDVWTKVKEGEFKGFSVEGFFKYKRKEDDLVTLLEKLSAILGQNQSINI